MGLLEKARSGHHEILPSTARGGLYNRALSLKFDSRRPESSEKPLNRVETGIASPASFFETAMALIDANKCALFLKDDVSSVFSPWVRRGFDETTSRRLRFPVSAIEELFADGSWYRVIEGPELEEYRIFFSRNEYETIGMITIFPVRSAAEIIGMILFCDSSPDTLREADFLEKTARGLQAASSPIVTYRSLPFFAEGLSAVLPIPVLSEEISRSSREFQTDRHGGSLVALSLGAIVDAIADRLVSADKYRLFQDCFRIVSSVSSPLGKRFALGERIVLICVGQDSSFDLQLFVLQLQKTLKKYLPSWCEAPISVPYSGPLSGDASTLSAILTKLLAE
jgi:hypothetical protein